jgi:chemotaxis regulatin CheY-phosphate phosphatase CheZ
MLGIKQEGLAYELGEDWNQRKVSLLEQKEVIEDELLEKVASALKVPEEAIRDFDEQTAISMIAGTINNNHDQASIVFNSTVDYAERWLESLSEIRQLYERLLKEKDVVIEMLKADKF